MIHQSAGASLPPGLPAGPAAIPPMTLLLWASGALLVAAVVIRTAGVVRAAWRSHQHRAREAATGDRRQGQ